MQGDSNQYHVPHPEAQYHLIVRSLPQQFENSLNQAVQEGWHPLPESFRVIISATGGHTEYAILVRKDS